MTAGCTQCLGESACNEMEDCLELPAPKPVDPDTLCAQTCDHLYDDCGAEFEDTTNGDPLSKSECRQVCAEMDVTQTACLGDASCNNLDACFYNPEPTPQPQPGPGYGDDTPTSQELGQELGKLGYGMPVYNW